jgi:hypothetical protein
VHVFRGRAERDAVSFIFINGSPDRYGSRSISRRITMIPPPTPTKNQT